ncbi:DUF305 domain-containing protein [Kineococcus gynurae]|uniref:DUF305 domain-containing protein n=1 Tax=Kineococcus gynurae TaxID=452979 RepID=A0ABV5LNA6_9ACTN
MTPRRVLIAVVALLAVLLAGVLLGRALPSTPGAQSVDVGFAQDMATHHQQAVQMAVLAVERTPSPDVQALAEDMLLTQQNQVGRLQQLLGVWDQPVANTGEVMGWMAGTDLHARHLGEIQQGRTMPGMATAVELNRLREETGEQFEVDFLQLMLRHHAGGIEMAEFAADRATTEEVRSLARAIAGSQTSETELLTDLLAQRGAEPLGPAA